MLSTASRSLGLMLLTVTAFVGCRVTDLPLWDAPEARRPDVVPVRELLDVAYVDGPDADPRQKLDLYIPEGREKFPVVVLVHGGAWMVGDNRSCGLYPSVARFFASRGIGVAMPNYRLSPAVRHPEHVRDVARAVRWTKTHIGELGGDPSQLFLMGHSAGGHLVALLATDKTHLKAVEMSPAEIRGVIGVSGVYEIPPGDVSVTLGGDGPLAIRIDKMVPIRGDTKPRTFDFCRGPGVPIRVNVFGPAFGDNPADRAAASPIRHIPRWVDDEVAPQMPPFLVFTAENDLPILTEIAVRFVAKLDRNFFTANHVAVPRRNHNSIMFDAITDNDTVAAKTIAFISNNTQ